MTDRRPALVEAAALCAVPALVLVATQLVLGQSSIVDQFRQVQEQERHLRSVLPDADTYDFVDAALPHFSSPWCK